MHLSMEELDWRMVDLKQYVDWMVDARFSEGAKDWTSDRPLCFVAAIWSTLFARLVESNDHETMKTLFTR